MYSDKCRGIYLSASFISHVAVYSQITGNLIKSRMNIKPDIVHCLPMNVPCKVEDTEVTLLDANQYVYNSEMVRLSVCL